jgi:hypothetical protein
LAARAADAAPDVPAGEDLDELTGADLDELGAGAAEQPAARTPPARAAIAIAMTLRTWILMSRSLAVAAIERLRQST